MKSFTATNETHSVSQCVVFTPLHRRASHQQSFLVHASFAPEDPQRLIRDQPDPYLSRHWCQWTQTVPTHVIELSLLVSPYPRDPHLWNRVARAYSEAGRAASPHRRRYHRGDTTMKLGRKMVRSIVFLFCSVVEGFAINWRPRRNGGIHRLASHLNRAQSWRPS